jgi:serine/threonine protein kinase
VRLKSGVTLQGGKYRIVETLGCGGFGITYLAEQKMFGRMVCIKEFFPTEYYNRDATTNRAYVGSQGSVEMMDRFKRKFIKEAQTIACFDHPNIIPIYDIFEENNTAYYVMKYVDGGSLSDVVRAKGPLSERDAVRYIKGVARALAYIHSRSVNHLDIKPSNIMLLGENDEPILIDFGLAKRYDSSGGQTSTTPVGISHGYAPIEQYNQGGVSNFSPSTDIYSLGATLYYLISGCVPPAATESGRSGVELPSVAMSSGVSRAISSSMSYWREDRPQTIDAFLALVDGALQPVAGGGTIVADNRVDSHPDDKTRAFTQGAPTPKPPKHSYAPRPEQPYNAAQKPHTPEVSPYSWTSVWMRCYFFGFFGAHCFYVGRINDGFKRLFTFGGFGWWWIIDLLAIANGEFKDSAGRVIPKVTLWDKFKSRFNIK